MKCAKAKENVRGKHCGVLLEILSIAALRGAAMALSMLRGQKKVTYILLAMSILLQMVISSSVLYVSHTRSGTCNHIKVAYEKSCMILSSSREGYTPFEKQKKRIRPTFIAEIMAQMASGVGVTVVTFFYKEGRLAISGYATLMLFFFILGSLSSLSSVVDRRESSVYVAKLNAVLDDVLARQSSTTDTLSTMTEKTKKVYCDVQQVEVQRANGL
ncbi:hypothetical protein [Neorickettsia findlayensis]|uniref:Uncharacterized protein n=1 Tax=Neorickettsia findlayensis TaxID=2686014 RepID=A0A6P1GAW6_9RICK|nr:hypothetical protein [Neorickettsia findlayensis]QHD65343.1 hypothetical protein GP480_02715 [Neorickettsia findlayensis]